VSARQVAAALAVRYAGVGLLLALALLASMGETAVLRWGAPWLGAIAVLAFAGGGGALLANVFAHAPRATAIAIGMLQMLLVLTAGVTVGAIPGLVDGWRSSPGPLDLGEWLFDWLAKPLCWVLLFGSAPALLLGAACGLHTAQRLRR
jgi:hypothetical protein